MKSLYGDTVIERALRVIEKAAGDTSESIYDRNKDVYDLLRYGANVKTDVGRSCLDKHGDGNIQDEREIMTCDCCHFEGMPN